MESYETCIYIVRSAGLGKIFCNFLNKLIFFLIFLIHLLNARQMLTYDPTLILNVFAMMPEKHYYS